MQQNHQPSLLRNTSQNPLPHFFVITTYFNPCRYANRFENYFKFARGLRDQRVNLLTVELSTDVFHLSADVCNIYVPVQQKDVLWAKERLLNIALRHLPPHCTQVCWCDCDILFQRPQWAFLCSELLKKHRVVQPFGTCIFLGPDETPTQHQAFKPSCSFARYYFHTMNQKTFVGSTDVLTAHPGYAWAARRDVLQRLGGFLDFCILGHADIAMGLAFCHALARDGPIPDTWEPHWEPGWNPALKSAVRRWQQHAASVVHGDVSYVQGEIYHLWHGNGKNRQYTKRGELIQDFDPALHLVPAASGMWAWTEAATALELDKKVLQYFASRKEDSARRV